MTQTNSTSQKNAHTLTKPSSHPLKSVLRYSVYDRALYKRGDRKSLV